MTRHVSALFDGHEEAASALQLLKQHEFTEREMTVVAKPDDDEADDTAKLQQSATKEANDKAGTWVGSALGAAVAGTTGLLSMALIPAVPLLMVGGAAMGGGAGKLLGGADLGPKQRELLEQKLRAGGVLIVVHQETEERAKLAEELLGRAHAHDIAITA